MLNCADDVRVLYTAIDIIFIESNHIMDVRGSLCLGTWDFASELLA